MGTAGLIKAWSDVLADRLDSVSSVVGAKQDVIEAVGSSTDEKAQIPFILKDRQIKGFSMLAFVVRYVWDLFTKKTIQAHIIYLPAKFMSQLHQTAHQQLKPEEKSERPLFLSDGDLITAWFSRMVISSRSAKRPAIICNVFDLRSRLNNTFVFGATYLQNLILPASVFLPAVEASTVSLGPLALKLREAVAEQTTDPQARSLLRIAKASYASTGSMPLFGSSDSMIIACTNWSKAGLLAAADLGPAVISQKQPTSDERPAMPPGTCVSYWGTTIGNTDKPRDTVVIYNKDGDGNYWIHGYLRPETCNLIQHEFSRTV